MEQTECSETSAYELQTPGNYPKESIQHTEHGESLKSRIPGRFAVYTGENANHGVKFVAHFCPTNSRVRNAAALIDVDSSPSLFSHAAYFQVTGRCFDGYGL